MLPRGIGLVGGVAGSAGAASVTAGAPRAVWLAFA